MDTAVQCNSGRALPRHRDILTQKFVFKQPPRSCRHVSMRTRRSLRPSVGALLSEPAQSVRSEGAPDASLSDASSELLTAASAERGASAEQADSGKPSTSGPAGAKIYNITR